VQNIPDEAYILVESFTDEYMLRVDFHKSVLTQMLETNKYVPLNDGRIQYDYLERKGNVRLSWGPLYKVALTEINTNKVVEGVKYKLVFSENPKAVMDSVCAIKR
jgi:hypothetical protein